MRYLIRATDNRMDWVEQHMLPRLPKDTIVTDDSVTPEIKTGHENDPSFINFLKGLIIGSKEPIIQLEDDVILTNNFVEKSRSIVEKHNDMVISFFSMRKDDIKIGSRLINGSQFCMTQCIFIPPIICSELLEYEWDNYEYGAYDYMVRDFLKSRKMKYFNYAPSLVQHRKVVSEIDRRRSKNRQSKTFTL